MFPLLIILISIVGLVLSAPNPIPKSTVSPRPLVIWHGLGDSAFNKGILEFAEAIKEIHPGIFVHAIHLADDEGADRKAGFVGKVPEQLEHVYEQLNAIPELADGFDAFGFSQGGLFFRAWVELYNSPPVHNLITFGSPHMGVSELPACSPHDYFCRLMHSIGKSNAYTEWAQNTIVPAQYFRDTERYATYLERNHWLPAITNEVASARNATYAENLSLINELVLVLFANDTILEPKESAWFSSYEIPDSDGTETWRYEDREINDVNLADEHWEDVPPLPTFDEIRAQRDPLPLVPMRDQPLYKEDWIGLRTLDERGAVTKVVCNGQHMHLSQECWIPLVEKYTGGTLDDARMKKAGGGKLVIQNR